MMLSVSPGYQLPLITPSVFSNVYDVVCVSRLSITLDYPSVFSSVYDVVYVTGLSITLDYHFGVFKRLWCCLCLQVINYSWLPLRCSLTFMMLSVSPGYQLHLITPSVFSNVYDVVCISGYQPFLITPSVSLTLMMLSVSPGYQLPLITTSAFSNVYDVVCVSRLSITLDYTFGVSNVYDVVCVSRLSITLDYHFGVSNVYDVVCLQVINYYWLPLRCSLMFMMLSVSPGYQLLLITPSVFSNVYDVVCFSRLSIILDYPFGFL